MDNKIVSAVKQPAKFILSKRERKKVFSENSIRKLQDDAIKQFDASAKKLIVFLLPGADRETGSDKISGGVMSIISLCEESTGMKDTHHAEVIASTLPNEYLLFKHTQFASNTNIFRFSQLKRYFKNAREVLFHLPEFTCDYFLEYLGDSGKKWLQQFDHVHFNILNQNILLMPSAQTINELKKIANTVTITTAHQRYCNKPYRDLYGVPLHKFSVWISPEKYSFMEYDKKENLIVVSPDPHPMKQEILDRIGKIEGITIQVIQNLTYEQYKATIAKAKWALTFGEGLDGYIIEPIFSGAIGFAVYNEDFFTPDFKIFETIYNSYEEMFSKIAHDIEKLDKKNDFKNYQQTQFDICSKHYSYLQYQQNIKEFYKYNYTFN